MKRSFSLGIAVLFVSSVGVFSQTAPEATPTPVKLVVTNSLPPPTRIAQPSPTPIIVGTRPRIVGDESDQVDQTDSVTTPVVKQMVLPTNFATMTFGQIKSRIAEAKRVMQTRPLQTASEDPLLANSLVRIAFYDWKTQHVDFVVLNKD